MLATYFLKDEISNVAVLPTNSDSGANHSSPQAIRPGRSKASEAASLVLAVCGAGWCTLASPGTVEQVHVTRKETFIELPRLFGNPSFYVQVRTFEGVQHLDTKPRTPIGNGLMWKLEQPVPLANVYEVQIFEQGLLTDKLVDRVTTNSRHAIGQRFQFDLEGQVDWQHPVAVLVTAASVFMLLILTLGHRRERSIPPPSAGFQNVTRTPLLSNEADLYPKLDEENGIAAKKRHIQ